MIRAAFGGIPYCSMLLDITALLGFTAVSIVLATFFHKKTRDRVV